MVHWSKKAHEDLQGIFDYINEDSPQNATMVLNTLLNLGDSLDTMPTRYPVEPFYGKKHTRYALKWNYKIIYRIHGENVTIKRVFHTKQNTNKI